MHTSAYRTRFVHLNSNDTLDEYAKRAHETITNTPIIHIGAQNGPILTIYVENLSDNFQFNKLKQIPEEQKFYLLESGIIGFMNLRRKYGCFKIDQSLMKTNQNGRLKVWIHRDPVKMIRQYPLPEELGSQSLMAFGIIKVFKTIIPSLEQIDKCNNLQQLLMHIHKLMSKQLGKHCLKPDQIGQKKQLGKFLKQKFQTAQKVRSVRRSQDPTSQMTHFTPVVRKKSVRLQHKQFQSSIDSILKNHHQTQIKPEITNPHFTIQQKIENKRFLQQTQHPIKLDKPYPNFLNHKNMSQSQFQLNSSEIYFENPQRKIIKKPKLSEAFQQKPQRIPGSMIAQETRQDLCEKQRLFQRPKFPYSTESTFVTLKQTKSFGQMPPFNDLQFPSSIIEEQKSSQNKDSSKGRSNVFTSQNDIQTELDNLFMGERPNSTDEIKNQKQYYQRQHQFQEILFS